MNFFGGIVIWFVSHMLLNMLLHYYIYYKVESKNPNPSNVYLKEYSNGIKITLLIFAIVLILAFVSITQNYVVFISLGIGFITGTLHFKSSIANDVIEERALKQCRRNNDSWNSKSFEEKWQEISKAQEIAKKQMKAEGIDVDAAISELVKEINDGKIFAPKSDFDDLSSDMSSIEAKKLLEEGIEYYNDYSFTRAKECFEKAANLGNDQAQSRLGYYYYYDFSRLGGNNNNGKELGISWWNKAASKGNLIAKKHLAFIESRNETKVDVMCDPLIFSEEKRKSFERMFQRRFDAARMGVPIVLKGKKCFVYNMNIFSYKFSPDIGDIDLLIEVLDINPRYFTVEYSSNNNVVLCEWIFIGEKKTKHINYAEVSNNILYHKECIKMIKNILEE